MSPDRRRIDPEILHDYVDNQLDDETRLEVARHIGENPLDAALVHAYRDQNEALQRLYGPTAGEPIPQHLLDMVEAARLESERERQLTEPPRVRSRWRGARAAALVAVVTLCLGGVAGWWGHGIREAGLSRHAVLNAFLDQAVQSYTLYAGSAGQPVDAPIDDVQKFTDWFKHQLNVRVLAPQLGAGFKLVSARILPMAFGTAGQLVYAEPGGQRIAVYMQVAAAEGGNPALAAASLFGGGVAFARHGQFSVYYWAMDNVAYALVSPLDQNALGAVMKKILDSGGGSDAPPPPSSSGKTRA